MTVCLAGRSWRRWRAQYAAAVMWTTSRLMWVFRRLQRHAVRRRLARATLHAWLPAARAQKCWRGKMELAERRARRVLLEQRNRYTVVL